MCLPNAFLLKRDITIPLWEMGKEMKEEGTLPANEAIAVLVKGEFMNFRTFA